MGLPTSLQKNIKRVCAKRATPFYIYDLNLVEGRIDFFKKKLRLNNYSLHYAVKANSNLDVLSVIKKSGCAADVVSAGELSLAIKAGFSPQDIIFSGVGKTSEELEVAIKKRIKQINIESVQELVRIVTIAKRLRRRAVIGVRMNLNISAKTHPYITTGASKNKFGLNPEDLKDVKRIVHDNLEWVTWRGVSIHIGSQITNLDAFKTSFIKIKDLAQRLNAEGFVIDRIDIGGGVGINYFKEAKDDLRLLSKYCELVNKVFGNSDCEILMEPGRILVARSGILVTQVQYLKSNGSQRFAIVDTGMHHLIRPALYEAYHRILTLETKERKSTKYNIVGPLCESSDFLALGRTMPILHQDDFLCVMDSGAYGMSMSSTYNSQKLPREFVIRNGVVRKSR